VSIEIIAQVYLILDMQHLCSTIFLITSHGQLQPNTN